MLYTPARSSVTIRRAIGHRRRCCGGGRIDHVEDRPTALEQEVVEQASVTSKYLRPDAGRTGDDVAVGERREITAHVGHSSAFDGSTPDLDTSGPPVSTGETPRPGIAEQLPRIPQPNAGATVALAMERRHCVRPRPNLTVHAWREVDAEKGKRRIRHRIDEPVHERPRVGGKLEVITAERGDAIPTLVSAGQSGQPVRLHAGADDHLPRGNRVPRNRAARRTRGRGSRSPDTGLPRMTSPPRLRRSSAKAFATSS